MSTEYTGPQGTFLMPFAVAGQVSIWYPFTSAPLAAGEQVILDGRAIFRSELRGQKVSIAVLADSCAGDEFMPTYCRVEESDEMWRAH